MMFCISALDRCFFFQVGSQPLVAAIFHRQSSWAELADIPRKSDRLVSLFQPGYIFSSVAHFTGYNRNGVIQPKISPILSEAGKRRLARALERQKQHPDSKDGKEGEKKREKKTQPKKDAKKKAPKDHVELSSVNVQ